MPLLHGKATLVRQPALHSRRPLPEPTSHRPATLPAGPPAPGIVRRMREDRGVGLTRHGCGRLDLSRRTLGAAHRHLRQLPVAAWPRPATGPAAPSAGAAGGQLGGGRRTGAGGRVGLSRICRRTSPNRRTPSCSGGVDASTQCAVARSGFISPDGRISSTRNPTIVTSSRTARSSSRRTCSDVSDAAEKTTTITRLRLIASTIASRRLIPGMTSRGAIHTRMPVARCSRHTTSATAVSFSEYETKTSWAMRGEATTDATVPPCSLASSAPSQISYAHARVQTAVDRRRLARSSGRRPAVRGHRRRIVRDAVAVARHQRALGDPLSPHRRLPGSRTRRVRLLRAGGRHLLAQARRATRSLRRARPSTAGRQNRSPTSSGCCSPSKCCRRARHAPIASSSARCIATRASPNSGSSIWTPARSSARLLRTLASNCLTSASSGCRTVRRPRSCST